MLQKRHGAAGYASHGLLVLLVLIGIFLWLILALFKLGFKDTQGLRY